MAVFPRDSPSPPPWRPSPESVFGGTPGGARDLLTSTSGRSNRVHAPDRRKKAWCLLRSGFSPAGPAFPYVRLLIQSVVGWTIGWISVLGGTAPRPALADAVRRQGQFPGKRHVGARQFFNDGVPDELRPVSVTGRPQPGIQFPQKLFVHRNRQQLLTRRALIRHGDSYTLLCRQKNQKNVDSDIA